jgi:hypothetical protein
LKTEAKTFGILVRALRQRAPLIEKFFGSFFKKERLAFSPSSRPPAKT